MNDSLGSYLSIIIFLIIVVALVFSAKAGLDAQANSLITTEEYYKIKGGSGEHQIALIDPTRTEIQGSLSGSAAFFIVGFGSIEGSFSPEAVITFEWIVPSGMTQITSYPYEKILWDFDDSYVNPTFEFNFTKAHLDGYISSDTEIITYNTLFDQAEAITIHTTRDVYLSQVFQKLQK